MARIRSVHPGQFTDEDFVSCSPLARILAIGLRCEADDCGIFEWKPVGLKMRLLPADAADINDLLADLVEHRQVMRFEHGGKSYGAIRNFCHWQRPKEPGQKYPLTAEVAQYVGLEEDDYRKSRIKISDPEPSHGKGFPSASPALPQRFPKAVEMAPQREESLGRRDSEEIQDNHDKTESREPPRAASGPEPPPLPDFKAMVWRVLVDLLGESSRSLIGRWCRDYGDAGVFDAYNAFRAASMSGEKVEPKAYLIATLQRQAGERGDKSNVGSLKRVLPKFAGSEPPQPTPREARALALLRAETHGSA